MIHRLRTLWRANEEARSQGEGLRSPLEIAQPGVVEDGPAGCIYPLCDCPTSGPCLRGR